MNTQKPEKSVLHPQGFLELHSIFHTIQGEGPFTGFPAVFIRLAGCNLQCPACDTDYTSARFTLSPRAIVALVKEQASKGLVVITGGEPFRQDIMPLCRQLIWEGYFVQIETNGTLAPSEHEMFSTDLTRRDCVFVVCSPKTGRINIGIEDHICAYKYILEAGDACDDGLPLEALGHSASPCVCRPHSGFTGHVYVQPLDEQDAEKNQANTLAAVRSCKKNGHVLQLQTHKILNLE